MVTQHEPFNKVGHYIIRVVEDWRRSSIWRQIWPHQPLSYANKWLDAEVKTGVWLNNVERASIALTASKIIAINEEEGWTGWEQSLQ